MGTNSHFNFPLKTNFSDQYLNIEHTKFNNTFNKKSLYKFLKLYFTQIGFILSFSPLILITCGVLAILITEIRMKRKDLLNYL